jgi:branched-chain amino acid transport system permease protein
MDIETILQTLVNGFYLGGIFSLVAIGLTLVYGVMYLINFAHADFFMLGMYATFWFVTITGFDPYIAIPLVGIGFFIFGAIVYWGLIRRILNAQLMNQVMLTLGLSTLIIGIAQFLWRTDPKSISVPYSFVSLDLGGIIFNLPRTISLAASILLAVLLYLFMKKTRLGKAIRACAQSREAAQLVGINVQKIYMITFGIGIALAGIAGCLMMVFVPVNPNIGQSYAITAFVIVVLGTMGNFIGALIGGFIIGIAESFGGLFISGAMRQVVSMAIFVVILLLMPRGLFGGRN